MGALFWVLIVFTAVLFCILCMLIAIDRRRRKELRQNREQKLRSKPAQRRAVIEEDVDFLDDIPIAERTAAPRSVVRPSSPYAGTIEILRKKYDSVRNILKIPRDAALVWRKIDIFCMKSCDVLHYCWCSSTNLYFFPKWESIAASLVAGAITRYMPGDENKLITVTIPKSSIEQWIKLPDGKVGLLYKRKRNKKVILRLEDTVLPVFEGHLADKEHSYVMKYVYPKSPQNIFDIKGEFVKIKKMRENGDMTDEEFEHRKVRIVLTK